MEIQVIYRLQLNPNNIRHKEISRDIVQLSLNEKIKTNGNKLKESKFQRTGLIKMLHTDKIWQLKG